MFSAAKKYSEKVELKNIRFVKQDMNDDKWVGAFPEKSFHGVILFQSIHFASNIYRQLDRVSKLLKENGVIIIASTSHKQFFELPYCKAFPGVLELELNRTPDIQGVEKFLSMTDKNVLVDKFSLIVFQKSSTS